MSEHNRPRRIYIPSRGNGQTMHYYNQANNHAVASGHYRQFPSHPRNLSIGVHVTSAMIKTSALPSLRCIFPELFVHQQQVSDANSVRHELSTPCTANSFYPTPSASANCAHQQFANSIYSSSPVNLSYSKPNSSREITDEQLHQHPRAQVDNRGLIVQQREAFFDSTSVADASNYSIVNSSFNSLESNFVVPLACQSQLAHDANRLGVSKRTLSSGPSLKHQEFSASAIFMPNVQAPSAPPRIIQQTQIEYQTPTSKGASNEAFCTQLSQPSDISKNTGSSNETLMAEESSSESGEDSTEPKRYECKHCGQFFWRKFDSGISPCYQRSNRAYARRSSATLSVESD